MYTRYSLVNRTHCNNGIGNIGRPVIQSSELDAFVRSALVSIYQTDVTSFSEEV
jgi:hypothetical protein